MIQSEKELLLQLLVEKYTASKSKPETPIATVKTTRKYKKRAKHTRKNNGRINWTPELKTALIEWHEADMPIDLFARDFGLRKTQVVSMLYDLTKRNPISNRK